ncbi:hypothetical protein RvY_10687 [Ramazzottius varieornatus]|uniref:Uncharacterized protein n=1 Tax=Ramazzottius varieornatus TaxID=947166 RepID=A0A1D1VDJ8_RAMVA|nr:hypothetical protein RvY_10687 [Ramazzottius varieornatus]
MSGKSTGADPMVQDFLDWIPYDGAFCTFRLGHWVAWRKTRRQVLVAVGGPGRPMVSQRFLRITGEAFLVVDVADRFLNFRR